MTYAFGRRICVALCVVTASLLQPAATRADTLSDLMAKITQAQQAVKGLIVRREGQQEVVESLRGATQAYVAELRRVDQELLAAVSTLRAAEADLGRVEAETLAVEEETAQKQEAVDRRAEVYSGRVRALYKFTRTSPLEQLLGARDFSEALSRLTMMQAVTRVDNLLLGQLRADYDALVKARQDLVQKQQAAAALRDEIEQQRQVLVARRADQAALTARAMQEQGRSESSLSDLDRQASALTVSIAAWQAQHEQELEELERQRVLDEQRRAEEARRQEEVRRAEEAFRLEEQRRLNAQATATAQAQAQATIQAQATARAQVQATTQAQAAAGAQATTRAQASAQVQATAVAVRAQPTPAGTPPLAATADVTRGATLRLSPVATASPRAGSGLAGTILTRPLPTAIRLPASIQTASLQPSAAGLIWPVIDPVVTTEFGERTFAQAFHTGIDLAQRVYSPVLAAGDGVVMERGLAVADKPSLSYGMMVTIAHSKTISTLYAHLDERNYQPLVKIGEKVKRGQIIGFIGMTGITSGPHLHFEVRVSGDCKDPRGYLPKE